jgi:hypothetical protein
LRRRQVPAAGFSAPCPAPASATSSVPEFKTPIDRCSRPLLRSSVILLTIWVLLIPSSSFSMRDLHMLYMWIRVSGKVQVYFYICLYTYMLNRKFFSASSSSWLSSRDFSFLLCRCLLDGSDCGRLECC